MTAKTRTPQPTIPDSAGDDPEDVFTVVGFASFIAQGLEAELVNLATGLRAAGDPDLIPDRVDEVFDEHESQTLGTLVRSIRARVGLPTETELVIREAVTARNRLTHHFFRLHTDNFLSAVGRREMIRDAQAIAASLLRADAAAQAITTVLWARLGLTREMIADAVAAMQAEARDRDQAV